MQDEQQPQAGWVFTPGQQTPVTPTPAPQPQPQQLPPQQPTQPTPVVQLPQTPQHQAPAPEGHVSWTASEYVAHQKGANWFLMLGLGAVILAAIIYFLTKDVISPGVIIIVAAIFGSFAARKPQVLQYSIDDHGIRISSKTYAYSMFKAFSVSDDSAIGSINFLPVKRFMPGLTIHFEDQDGDKIVDALGDYLPLEDHKPDMVDRVMNKLRF